MHHYNNIAFIGAGNLAWHLAPALENQGHRVSMVTSLTRKSALALIDRLYSASYKKTLDFSLSDVDIIIIAVKDSHIEDVVSEIITPEHAMLVHTSGTQPMEVLEKAAPDLFGVLYPLQTFTRGIKSDLRDTPFFLEANSSEALRILQNITKGITKHVFQITSDQRSILHLSAVFGSNFSNHMLTIAKLLMDEHDMDYRLLQNLISTMFVKAFENGPEIGQTGPAIRNDLKTLKKHMLLLKNKPELQKIYSMISEHISKTYNKK